MSGGTIGVNTIPPSGTTVGGSGVAVVAHNATDTATFTMAGGKILSSGAIDYTTLQLISTTTEQGTANAVYGDSSNIIQSGYATELEITGHN
jgi:hypothetical protein